MQIVDSHVHYWDPAQMRLVWLDAQTLIDAPVQPDSVPAGGSGWTVEKIVAVQSSVISQQALVEAEWLSSLAAQDSRIRAIIAFAPVEEGANVRAWLDRLKVLPMVRGVERPLKTEAAGFAVSPAFIEGVRALADYGWSFGISAKTEQLGDATALAQACPNVQFALNHAGYPDIAGKAFETWRNAITPFAALPNVVCKLSGLLALADNLNWTPPDLQPYIDHVIASFGVDRVMFGSNSPMYRLAGSTYAAWADVALRAISKLGAADQEKIFTGNAARFYKI
mgnify:CR=1 FL=1